MAVKKVSQEELERYDQLRSEFTSHAFRKTLNERFEKICYNCGSNADVEFHHIVPLSNGGTNRITNIAPLCLKCHDAAHDGLRRGQYAGRRTGKTGRATKISYEKAKVIFKRFLGGEIGNKECMFLLGYNSKTHLTDLSIFKKYLQENEIEDYRNNIDMRIHKKSLKKNAEVGYVKYTDGRVEKMIYRPKYVRAGKYNQLELNI